MAGMNMNYTYVTGNVPNFRRFNSAKDRGDRSSKSGKNDSGSNNRNYRRNRNGGYGNRSNNFSSGRFNSNRNHSYHQNYRSIQRRAYMERSTVPNKEYEHVLFGKDEHYKSDSINFDIYDKIPVNCSGKNIPKHVNSFQEAQLNDLILTNVKRCKYNNPTPVQKYSLPVICNGRDLMACAQTGSGKTAAFLLPIINNLLKSYVPFVKGSIASPSALILSPTRELAQQTYNQAKKFLYLTGLRACVVYGGTHVKSQALELEGGAELLVATTGRLYDMVEKQQRVSLKNVQVLCLDEADRMLDMGFEPQIRVIATETDMPPKGERQTLMYSATFPEEIQQLAQDFLKDYIFLTVGRVGSTMDTITQNVEYVPEGFKLIKLVDHLTVQSQGRILVFVQTKKKTDELLTKVRAKGFPGALVIHGDKSQREREKALHAFKKGTFCRILLATDVASRGLDIPNVVQVIQYDAPSNIEDYVHRIGRTGRCGTKGTAITFINEKDRPILEDLHNTLVESKQEVPGWYKNMVGVVCNKKKRRSRFGGSDVRMRRKKGEVEFGPKLRSRYNNNKHNVFGKNNRNGKGRWNDNQNVFGKRGFGGSNFFNNSGNNSNNGYNSYSYSQQPPVYNQGTVKNNSGNNFKYFAGAQQLSTHVPPTTTSMTPNANAAVFTPVRPPPPSNLPPSGGSTTTSHNANTSLNHAAQTNSGISSNITAGPTLSPTQLAPYRSFTNNRANYPNTFVPVGGNLYGSNFQYSGVENVGSGYSGSGAGQDVYSSRQGTGGLQQLNANATTFVPSISLPTRGGYMSSDQTNSAYNSLPQRFASAQLTTQPVSRASQSPAPGFYKADVPQHPRGYMYDQHNNNQASAMFMPESKI